MALPQGNEVTGGEEEEDAITLRDRPAREEAVKGSDHRRAFEARRDADPTAIGEFLEDLIFADGDRRTLRLAESAQDPVSP